MERGREENSVHLDGVKAMQDAGEAFLRLVSLGLQFSWFFP